MKIDYFLVFLTLTLCFQYQTLQNDMTTKCRQSKIHLAIEIKNK